MRRWEESWAASLLVDWFISNTKSSNTLANILPPDPLKGEPRPLFLLSSLRIYTLQINKIFCFILADQLK